MSQLKFLEIAGIDFCRYSDLYPFLIDRPDTTFYKMIGEFFVDGLAVDGELFISEDHLNFLLQEYDLRIKLVKDNTGYTVNRIDDAARRRLNAREYVVELVDFIEEEEEDTHVYGLLGIK